MSFGSKSTTDQVLHNVDLRGRRVLVTGVSSGLGVETARALVARGAVVVGAARDLAKAERATFLVSDASGAGGSFALVDLDLSSLASVDACADRLLSDGRRFDLVVANAGVMAPPFGRTADGFETQFGTNHIGHFVLVNRISPLIDQDGRLVVLSSGGHRYADVDLDDPNFEHKPYDPWLAYGQSKTANILFAVEFDRRHRGRGVRAASVHPGLIQTELNRHLGKENERAQLAEINRANLVAGLPPLEFKTVQQGAATSVWAGVVADAELVGGRYCEDCHVAEVEGRRGLRGGVQPYAVDPQRAKALWAKTERLIGRALS